jgi:hypothetical protein
MKAFKALSGYISQLGSSTNLAQPKVQAFSNFHININVINVMKEADLWKDYKASYGCRDQKQMSYVCRDQKQMSYIGI